MTASWKADGLLLERSVCQPDARLMDLVASAGLPPRIMDPKLLEIMPINHGRATLMIPAQLNHQRFCVREARDVELVADRQSAVECEAKAEVAKAKMVASGQAGRAGSEGARN